MGGGGDGCGDGDGGGGLGEGGGYGARGRKGVWREVAAVCVAGRLAVVGVADVAGGVGKEGGTWGGVGHGMCFVGWWGVVQVFVVGRGGGGG